MKRILLSTVLLLFAIGFSACKKDTVWVYHDITRSDVSTVNGIGCVKAAKKYLRSKNIQVFKAEFTSDGTLDPCSCSDCRTGKRIKCEIREEDLDKATEENFYQE